MGSIRGQELGLGSGIVNMSRQVGFAIGVALLVAVFTGTIDEQPEAGAPGGRCARAAARRGAERPAPNPSLSSNPRSREPRCPSPKTPLEREAQGIVRAEVRDSYGAAFRVAGLVDPARDSLLAHDAKESDGARGRGRRRRGGRLSARAPSAGAARGRRSPAFAAGSGSRQASIAFATGLRQVRRIAVRRALPGGPVARSRRSRRANARRPVAASSSTAPRPQTSARLADRRPRAPARATCSGAFRCRVGSCPGARGQPEVDQLRAPVVARSRSRA